jgi:hypothetical protein
MHEVDEGFVVPAILKQGTSVLESVESKAKLRW